MMAKEGLEGYNIKIFETLCPVYSSYKINK